MPNVSYTRQEVLDLRPLWVMIRDCIEGQAAVKKKGTVYLPKPNPSDQSPENEERYRQYKERAVFYNVTGRTLRGLVGQVFTKEPTADLPAMLSIMEKDVDGAGVTLEQQAKKTLGGVLAYGRVGMLCDYPAVEGTTSRQDLVSGRIRPTLHRYEPEDVINWRVETFGGKRQLTLVVLKESYVAQDDGFEEEKGTQYRVLRLTQEGYLVEIWREDHKGQWEVASWHTPRDSKGRPLREIPFLFVGAENNDAEPDTPPMYDMAALNIAHYRNSADYEEAAYVVGQPTPYLAGLSQTWVNQVLKGTVALGSRAAIPLPEGGSAGLLQAQPNTMPKEAMEAKERQMVALGAKLVEQAAVQRTATEAVQEEMTESSALSTAAKNVSSAYTQALQWAAMFVGAPDSQVSYELSTDFDLSRMSAEERKQLIAEWQGGAISFTEMRDGLRKAGVAYLDDEAVKEEMENDPFVPVVGEPPTGEEDDVE